MSNGATLGYSASILLISLKFCLDTHLLLSFMPKRYLLLRNVTDNSFGLYAQCSSVLVETIELSSIRNKFGNDNINIISGETVPFINFF